MKEYFQESKEEWETTTPDDGAVLNKNIANFFN